MPFTDAGASYEELLDKLRDNRSSWESASTFAECQQAISEISDVDTETFDALVEDLRKHHDDDEQMLRQLRLTALAWPASDYGLAGAEWQGYFVTELADGQEVYAADRFAEPGEWAKVEVATQALALTFDQATGLLYDEVNWYLPDGQTIVTLDQDDPAKSRDSVGNLYVRGVLQEGAPTVADLRQNHFDPETQRWRRWSDEGGEFEYYHNEDGVWEYLRGKDAAGKDVWHRYHSVQQGWVRYDHDTDRWFDPKQNQWCAYERVGGIVPAALAPEEPAASALGQPMAGQAPEMAPDAGTDGEQDLELADLNPELQAFLNKLYEINPEHRNVPIRTVLEVVAESGAEL